MTYRSPAQRARDLETDEARAQLISLLRHTVGPDLTASQAQGLLEGASAWHRAGALPLALHVADLPHSLTAPSAHCPATLPRLLQRLEAAGHGGLVTQLGCASCGSTGRKLARLTPQGRVCHWCANREELRTCDRCGNQGHIVTRTQEGRVCRTCYNAEHRRTGPCSVCGRTGTYPPRRKDGVTVTICFSCADHPEHICARCGELGRAESNFPDEGPLCSRCYRRPSRLCGQCGRIRQVGKRGRNGEPDICDSCHQLVGKCGICGRTRTGSHRTQAGGDFICGSCYVAPNRECSLCNEVRPSTANWPVGPVCGVCYAKHRSSPGSCASCGNLRTLVGRDADGRGLCGPCCGSDIDYVCRRCGYPGEIHKDGLCLRCVVHDRVHDLLSDEDGDLVPALAPLADALTTAKTPSSILVWLERSPSVRLLAALAAKRTTLTHALLDYLPQNASIHHLRKLLIDTRILPARHEALARLELWFATTADQLPPPHAQFIRPFAEWCVIRDARRRAVRDNYTGRAATVDRADIRAAIELLTWIDTENTALGELSQTQLDLWLTTAKPSRSRKIGSFIRWTNRHHLTRNLEFPVQPRGQASRFQSDEDQEDQLRRCLTDGSLPLDVRIAGALTRLYGLPLQRISLLRTEGFHRDENNAYFTFEKNPVLLPPTLAKLIERRIREGTSPSAIEPTAENDPAYLFPGRPATRPRSPGALAKQLLQADLPSVVARNTAMFNMATELPPIIISDLFGIHRNTAAHWAALAQNSWIEYMAAITEE